jgi:DNA polymerase-3 subunit delta
MAAPSFDSIRKSIARGEIAPVYYLGGADELRKDELIRDILEAALEPGARDFNLDVRSASDLDAESLHTLIETPPLLALRRAVVVRGVEQWRKNARTWPVLHRYLERPAETTLLILVQGAGEPLDAAVAAKALHAESDQLDREALVAWIAERARRAGLTLEPDAADHLVRAVGADTTQLAAELDKLAAARGDHPVTTHDVAEMVGVRRGETVSDWIDAVLLRDTKSAMNLLDVVLPQAGVSGVRIVATLGSQLLGVRLGRALLDRGTPPARLTGELLNQIKVLSVRGLGSWGPLAATWAKAAQRWRAHELDAAVSAAYQADRQLKSTTVTDERGVLADLVLGLSARDVAA